MISFFLDFLFSNLNPPSMIAAAAICAAFKGLRYQLGSLCPSKYELVQMITEITGVEEVGVCNTCLFCFFYHPAMIDIMLSIPFLE